MTIPSSTRISAFALKSHVAHWLQCAGAQRDPKNRTGSDAVGHDASSLIGDVLEDHFLHPQEGFFGGFVFAIECASHVLSDPWGDPTLLIQSDANDTREFLRGLADDAAAMHEELRRKDEQRAQRPPREMLEAPRGPYGFDPLALGC